MNIKVVTKPVLVMKSARIITLRELINQHVISNEADNKSPKTVHWYKDLLNQFLSYLESHDYQHTLSAFNMDIIRGYILFLRQRPRFQGHPFIPEKGVLLSPKTVQCHVRVLKAFSTWLYEEGYTTQNRLKNLKLPKAPKKIIEPITPEEIKNLIALLDRKSLVGARNYAILITLLDTGLRASELANITLNNLNLKDGYIKVMGKGAKERIVPIGKYTRMMLWSHIDKERLQPTDVNNNTLFLSHSGKPISVNTIKLVFSRMAKSSGIERVHAHLCRHTFAINYLLNGGDIFSLKEILGHATLDMVNHYIHFTSSQITAQHHKYSPMDKLQSEIK